MATPSGLLVPIIRNVETLSIAEIAAEIDRLAKLGKDGRLGAADLAVPCSNAGNAGNKERKNGNGNGSSASSSGSTEAATKTTAATPATLNTGPTFTISNIGSMAAGAGVVAPVIVPPQVAILAVGRAKLVPAFVSASASAADSAADAGVVVGGVSGGGGALRVVAREECTFSWSADHRVLDGAMVARCAEMVRGLVEGAGEEMLLELR